MHPPRLRGRRSSPLYDNTHQPFLPSVIEYLDLDNGSEYSARRRMVAWTRGIERINGPPRRCCKKECKSRLDGIQKFRLFVQYADSFMGLWRAQVRTLNYIAGQR